jgi:hypothetical protein
MIFVKELFVILRISLFPIIISINFDRDILLEIYLKLILFPNPCLFQLFFGYIIFPFNLDFQRHYSNKPKSNLENIELWVWIM